MTEQQYPTPKEREQTMKQRRRMLALAVSAAIREGVPHRLSLEAAQRALADYPSADAAAVMRTLEDMVQCSRLEYEHGYESQTYRNYLSAYRRFGGKRAFMRRLEFEDLKSEETALSSKMGRTGKETPAELRRVRFLHDLLLTDMLLWQDITPEDPPANPEQIPKVEDRR
ncbi:MAG: hypothetical protein NTW87_05475 [Planctomycetota bacterium]|nr:hypothetical protein [Planctomycetota bacterium]